jgi:hypothetical protein
MGVWDKLFAYYLRTIGQRKSFIATACDIIKLVDQSYFAILSVTVLAHQGQHSKQFIFLRKLQRK